MSKRNKALWYATIGNGVCTFSALFTYKQPLLVFVVLLSLLFTGFNIKRLWLYCILAESESAPPRKISKGE